MTQLRIEQIEQAVETVSESLIKKLYDKALEIPEPEEGEEDEGEVVILQIEDSDDENSEEESYISVEDEDVLNRVFEIFKEKFKDDFNFVD